MNSASFKITDYGLQDSLQNVLKKMEKAEKSALRKGANVMKKYVKRTVKSTGLEVTKKNPKYIDRLIDAVRVTKPRNGAIKVHILGSRKSGSGTYRLRFFESSTDRYAKTWKGKKLKKKRYLGNLSKFNGFFMSGINSSKSETMEAMDKALEKYIEKAFNG